MSMGRCIVLLVGGLASLWAVSSQAQEAVLGQKYGLGVHAYFSGDYPKAFDHLSAAIQGGSKDPRAFYFRGLSYLYLGRGPDAVADFKRGAKLESTDINKFYNVSKSLERVQGPGRVQLENYRMKARMTAIEQAERYRKARYETIRREEARVVREMLTESELIAAFEPAEEPAAKKSAVAPKKPAAEAAAERKKPADEASEPANADQSDPFATGSVKPAPAKKGGLLGAMGKAFGKVLGGKAPAKDQEQPAAEKKADPNDPFAP